jgi:hypothetical protein
LRTVNVSPAGLAPCARVLIVLLAGLAGGTNVLGAQADPAADCQAGRSSATEVVLPGNDPFAAPIAGAGEPRISLAYLRTHLTGVPAASGSGGSDFGAGVVSGGAVFGLWGRRDNCTALQVSLLGGVFSQFNMDQPSQALINSDFVLGGQVTHRRGPVSARVRVYHQSSHLGDEFLLKNPAVVRVNFSFQAVDVLVSLDREAWRLYGGGGYRVFSHADLSPGTLRAGVEAGRGTARGRHPRLVGAVDLTAHQAFAWRGATSAAGGLEWAGETGGRRLRALVLGFSGPGSWGQFFEERTRHVGVQLQFEF